MEIYAGKQPEASYKLSNSPADIVKNLFNLFHTEAETLHLIICSQV